LANCGGTASYPVYAKVSAQDNKVKTRDPKQLFSSGLSRVKGVALIRHCAPFSPGTLGIFHA
ncbi:hypothetical protein ABTF68_20835, partial [Acinetobacter baumannii]